MAKSKPKVSVIDVRLMTPDEERRFTAAIGSLVSELIEQELCGSRGDEHAITEGHLERQSIHLPCSAEQ